MAALALAACASYAVVVNLVPLLTERGIPLGIAAVVLGLGGAGQVLGRLGYPPLAGRTSVRARTTLTLAGLAVTTALLAAFTSLAALIAVAVLAGMVRGIATLVQATAVTDRWGAAHYGRLSGVLAAPIAVAAAVAPWVGAALAHHLGGYGPMFWVMAAIALRPRSSGRCRCPAQAQSLPRAGCQPVSRSWTRRSMSSRTSRIRSIPSMPRSDGSSVSQFSNRVPDTRLDVSLPTQGHDQVCGLHSVLGDRLRLLAGDVDADLGQRRGRQLVDLGAGFGAGRVDVDRVAGAEFHQAGGHLGLAAVLDADEQHPRPLIIHQVTVLRVSCGRRAAARRSTSRPGFGSRRGSVGRSPRPCRPGPRAPSPRTACRGRRGRCRRSPW